MDTELRPEKPKGRGVLFKLGVACASLVVTLALCEAAFRVGGYEPSEKLKIRVGDAVIKEPVPDIPFLYEPQSSFRHRWPSDPHGYFGNEKCEIRYRVNNAGFRGPRFVQRDTGKTRVAVLGDSFTFGVGVRRDDLFTTHLARMLSGGELLDGEFEVYNFGMPAFSTVAEVALLEGWVLPYRPEVCVIWYFLNDLGTKGTVFYQRGDGALKELRKSVFLLDAALRPLDSYMGLRQMVADYREDYREGSELFERMTSALSRFAAICDENDILPVLAVHPILQRLDAEYPFAGIHERVLDAARDRGIHGIDLFPYFEGRDSEELWVHETDHHPNHLAHRIAAEGFHRELEAFLSDHEEALRARQAAR